MSEPIYTYARGKGWTIEAPGVEVTMACGTKVSLHIRTPNPGEWFTLVDIGDSHWHSEGKPLTPWIDYHKSNRLVWLSVWGETRKPTTYDVYCVAVPV